MISALVITCLTLSASGDIASRFAECEHRFSGGCHTNAVFRYRLLSPESPQPGKRYPLVVWLHGVGEAGDDNRSQLRYLEMALEHPNRRDNRPFFLLAVQCPGGDPGWYGKSTPDDDMAAVAIDIVRKLLRELPIDEDRVSVAGVSSGGNGCWEMLRRHPGLFSAGAPMSSSGCDVAQASAFKEVPIWAFHNPADTAPTPDRVQTAVEAVNRAGGNATVTLTPPAEMTHDSWTAALKKHDALGWLLDQRRGGPCWTPPGCLAWTWRDVAAMPTACLAIVWLAWRREKRRRRKRWAAAAQLRPHLAICPNTLQCQVGVPDEHFETCSVSPVEEMSIE